MIQFNYSRLIFLTKKQLYEKESHPHLSSFFSNPYNSKEVFSFCEDNSLPSFLIIKSQSPLPLSYHFPSNHYDYCPEFDIYENDGKIDTFLSTFLPTKAENQILL